MKKNHLSGASASVMASQSPNAKNVKYRLSQHAVVDEACLACVGGEEHAYAL